MPPKSRDLPKIENVSPYGALDIPLLRRTVDAGEVVEVTVEQAERLLPQAENYRPANKAAEDILAALAGEPVPVDLPAVPAPVTGEDVTA